MIPVQEAINRLGGVGIQWHFTCCLERRHQRITLLTAAPDIGPIELRIEMPHVTQQVELDESKQVVPRTWERRASFEWPMDCFKLALSYGGRQEAITVLGPYMATLAHGYLGNETIPCIGVRPLRHLSPTFVLYLCRAGVINVLRDILVGVDAPDGRMW